MGSRQPVLEDLSPILIGVVWIAYGTLHIASPGSASTQVPEWASVDGVEPLFSASGMRSKIALGLLTISVTWRRPSLLAQMVLLAAMTPFVVYLLVNDKAVEGLMGTTMPHALARLVLVFHNILFLLWIHWAYRQTSGRQGGSSKPPPSPWMLSPVMVVALVMLAANVAGFGALAASPWYRALVDVWAMACLASGALIGFIFGVPRWHCTPRTPAPSASAGRAEREHREGLRLADQDRSGRFGLVELHELGPANRPYE